ncbi:hypothetical protein KCTCHS21_26610 [Cohnella abietis]|uniref:MurNAc-LAA domain-containing protein n=1 Tax=Cohnella abietis TaxID=2507935 RepID=A0A3T1D580_9BACL|nr:hypothetical protein KCTCHS21_26610 [Cohnella abietis]
MLFVVSVMLFLSAGIVHAAKVEAVVPQLILDGKTLKPDVAPIIMSNSVLIPVRIATESLGFKVDYDNKKRQVTVSNGVKQLIMTIDNKTALLDNEPKQMLVAPQLISNTTLIPLRFLGDSLGVSVVWDNKIKSVFLYSPDNSTPPVTEPPETETPTKPDDGEVDTPVTTPVINGNIYEVRYETNSVVLKYDGVIAPSIFKLDNPKRIVVDLPNTQYAPSGFLPAVDFSKEAEGKLLVTEHPALQSVRYSLFGEASKAPRFVLDLNQNMDYELINDTTIGELRIFLVQPVSVPIPSKSLYTVVLDAGHGGSDPGAISITKRTEKEFNLSVILKVQALLSGEEKIKLVMTRTTDTFPTLADRYNLANSVKADLFVSVHANSYTPATNGTETYYTREDSKAFATLMHSYLAPATGLKDNGVRRHSVNLAVTTKTTMPAILLEIGYLSSQIDEPQLFTEDLQNRVAVAIATGIKKQLKLI